MKVFICVMLALTALFCACGEETETASMNLPYVNITQEEAKKMMQSETDCVILDVRSEEEYASGHIPGALLIPHTDIEREAPRQLPNKDQLILVYCRSGRRSKIAAETLVSLGYTNIKEFGGIIDWQYEIES